MKDKNTMWKKVIRKANGMKLTLTFDTKKAAKVFYQKTKEEFDDEKIPVFGKISYKRKGKKVVFKGNGPVAADMLSDTCTLDD